MRAFLKKTDYLINKANLLYLLYFPIFLNFILNIFNPRIDLPIKSLKLVDVILSLLLFLFLINFGKNVSKVFGYRYASTGIMIYLLSFFIVENIFLLFLDQNNFNLIFLVVNVFWLVFLLFKNKNIFFQLKILLLVFLNNLFCRLFELYLTINKNIIGDVKDIHYEHVKNIFEKGYYYSINNPTLEGYTQTAAYVHAVLNKLLFYTNEYNYISSSTNVLLFYSFLLFMNIILQTN